MKLTLAQTETLKALSRLNPSEFHNIIEIVDARSQIRAGDHQAHFIEHQRLLISLTIKKLLDLQLLKLVRSNTSKIQDSTDNTWKITSKGMKVANKLF